MTWRVFRNYADPQMERAAQWTCDMLNGAEETAKLIGCTPAAIVAQAALETGWGRAAIGNNVFGIKADPSWHGAKQLRRTAEQRPDGSVYYINDWFRDYPSLAAGIQDHFEFLKRNARYKNVFDPDGTKSDHDYFQAMADAGYATDVRYAEKLDAMLASVHVYMKGMRNDGEAPIEPKKRLLMVGLQGADVIVLQQALTDLGYRVGAVDGDFGPRTYSAVKMFQSDRGITIDGIVGDETRRALHI